MTTENKKTIKKRFWQSFVLGFFVVFLLFGRGKNVAALFTGTDFAGGSVTDIASLGSADQAAFDQALGAGLIKVGDDGVVKTTLKGDMADAASWARTFAEQKTRDALSTLNAKTFWAAAQKSLNTIAYDTATWIGSGGKGQKPLFITEGWDKYLANIGDNFAGEYIEALSKKWDANLCNPSFDIKIKILGGLSGPYRKKAPACTFTTMKKNWESELARPDFLNRFQNMFEPNSNDLGIALSLQTNLMEASANKTRLAEERVKNKKGWLDVTDIAGNLTGLPTDQIVTYQLQKDGTTRAIAANTFTGTMVDAVNVFLNQLAATVFSNLLKSLTGAPATSPYTGDYGLVNVNAGGGSGGTEAVKEQFKKIIEPNFTVRGDYDILAELTICPDPTKAGPTNCVITDKFRQAIAGRMTVGEAMDQKYLNQDAIFGFRLDGLEPKYNEDYPYRSMIILRKFRILPVGWEVAAQYIKDPATGTGVRSLKDLVDCFSDNDARNGYSANWCKGLVDPDWVLKAPLGYCKKEGYGPEILSENITGEGSASKLSISRNNNYCADEQSCIKEKADGSCDVYGYCTEEKRKWNFGSNSCEPIYNTCQTFRSRQGNTVSYLQNGLDFNNCSADAVGCREYAMGVSASNGFYNVVDNSVKWSLSSASSTFNRIMSDCDVKGEGCHQFIRTEMSNGANIFGGFEDLFDATVDATAAFGDKSVKLTHDIATTVPAFKIDVDLKGYYYTFSVSAKNCGTNGVIGIGDSLTNYSSSTLETTDQWQRFAVSHYFNKENESNDGRVWIGVIGADYANCLIDGVKVEKSKNPTVFSEYAQVGVIYEKLLPNYLEYVCYDDPGLNYSLKSTAPAICNSFARKCNAEEVGCKMFTATTDKMTIPASVIPTDYCDASCNGYDEYLQSESAFDSRRSAYLIPTKTKTCGAEAVGCDQFTNLDKVGDSAQKEKVDQYGAEAVEYYSELKQCVKAGDVACAEFYTWEGSSETGFQLKVHQLKADSATDPAVSSDSLYNNKVCDSDTYGSLDNPMCFEFYNKTGKVSYKFLPYTIACSDDCHPYRRTAVNVDDSITTQAACGSVICTDEGADKKDSCWDAHLSNCNVCLNGGKWSVAGQACIYDAIPGEGKTCAATQDGCREYNGNSGANVQIVLQSDFEGSASGWQGLDGTQAILDSESLKSGENSLMITNASGDTGISYDVSDVVKQGKSYHLAFLAKGKSNLVNKFTNIYFDSGVASSSLAVNAVIKTDWNLYELNLTSLDHEISVDEKLLIKANGDFFIDNIILTEITDRYYLIKGSSVIPDVCNSDIFGNYQGPEYNLGCAEYSSEGDNNKHYLRQFTNLCQESAIGCEMMIDTHNSSSAAEDNIAFVVYSKDKECTSEEKGCERMGEVSKYDSGVTDSVIENFYTDVYKLNNPDNVQGKCAADQVGCDEWIFDTASNNNGGASLSYFKDPFDMTCEWRQKASSTDFDWYRKKISRCGGVEDGHICKSDKDCSTELMDVKKTCTLFDKDISCYVSSQKTIGYGGYGNIVDQPSNYWVGACPTSQSTCTEYIDPISNFSSNVIYNSDFSQDVDGNRVADGWSENKEQSVSLEPNTLYTFSVKSGSGFTASVTARNLTLLNEGNLFAASGAISITVNDDAISKSFYSNNSNGAVVEVSSSDVASGNSVSLKKSVIDYQLSQSVNRDECNGSLNPSKGCVLFNERKKPGVSYSGLIYDADTSTTTLTSVAGQNDSNVLLKVSPDRTCDEWLACKSYVKDENNNNVCYGVGLCDSIGANNDCNNFIVPDSKNQQAISSNFSKYQNASGYSEVGVVNNTLKKDMLPLASMTQNGGMTVVPNGDFERSASKYPLGWSPSNDLAWTNNLFSVVDNPITAQTEGIKYAGKGKAFLKYSPAAGNMESDFIDVDPGENYYLSADINTLNFFSKGNVPLSFYIRIQTFSSAGVFINSFDPIVFANGKDWSQVVSNFWVNNNVHRIKIEFLGWVNNSTVCAGQGDTCSGNVYVDNVVIKPALKTRVVNGFYDTVAPTCRLYPESDSLSCEYYEDSGIKKKGRYGYCLEYDRYPGNPNACLLWYPVDRIRGDWEEDVVGYNDRYPLYYCTQFHSRNLELVERRVDTRFGHAEPGDDECAGAYCNGAGCSTCKCPSGYIWEDVEGDGGWDGNPNDEYCHPSGTASACGGGYYLYDGDLQNFGGNAGSYDEAKTGVKLCDRDTGELFDPGQFSDLFYCTSLAKVVTFSNNKHWSGRVYSGSDYKIQTLNYGYKMPLGPFSGVVSPYLAENPAGWDAKKNTDTNTNVEPLPIKNFKDDALYSKEVNSGALYSCEGNCIKSGLCQKSRKFCYNLPVPPTPPNAVNPNNNFVNYFECAVGDVCETSFPVLSTGDNPVAAYDKIKRVFAESYGTWKWGGNKYVKTSYNWSVPRNICGGSTPTNVRPAYPDDFCGIPPRVSNLLIRGVINDAVLRKNGLINLSFNSILDSQQMPLVMYTVNWGDNNSDTVSGIEILPRMSTSSPHVLYYSYSYWDLKAKNSINNLPSGQNTVYCGAHDTKTALNASGDAISITATSTSDFCAVKPKVKLKDNWGWCTGGVDNTPCSDTGDYANYPGWVIVTEQ